MKNELKQFFQTAQLNRIYFILLLLRCPVDFMITSYNAKLLKYSLNAIETKDMNHLVHIFMIFLIACFGVFLYNGTIWNFFAPYVVKVQARVSRKLFQHISYLSDEVIEKKSTGEWITRMNIDVQVATDLIGGGCNIPHAFMSVFHLLLSMVALVLYDWRVLSITLIFTIPHIICNEWLIAEPMFRLQQHLQERIASLTSEFEPIMTSADTLYIYDAKEYVYGRIKKSSEEVRSANMKIQIRKAVGILITNAFGMGGYLMILLIGCILIMKGKGELSVLVEALQFRGGVMTAIFMLTGCLGNIRGNLAGILRVNEVFAKS